MSQLQFHYVKYVTITKFHYSKKSQMVLLNWFALSHKVHSINIFFLPSGKKNLFEKCSSNFLACHELKLCANLTKQTQNSHQWRAHLQMSLCRGHTFLLKLNHDDCE